MEHVTLDQTTFKWRPISFRFSVFVKPTTSFAGDGWWKLVTGEEPEESTSQPRSGTRSDDGQFRNGGLTLRIQPQRIDWIYGAIQDPLMPLQEIPTLGTFDEEAMGFVEALERWFVSENCPSSARIAFGCELMQPTDNIITGYAQLADILKIEIDAEDASDFLYQINRRRMSKTGIDNLSINRLSKWSVARVQQNFMSKAREHIITNELFACRLELDINTAPEYTQEILPKQLPILLDEFVTLGREIGIRGPVR